LSVCLSLCLFVSFVCLSVCLFVCLFVSFVCLLVDLFVCFVGLFVWFQRTKKSQRNDIIFSWCRVELTLVYYVVCMHGVM